MANQDLNPQFFPDGAVTVIPNKDFYALAQSMLPQVYQNAKNFMGIIFTIATIKQNIYDVIQSLCNVYNLYSSQSSSPGVAVPQGVYLKMLATNIGANFNESDSDGVIFDEIVDRLNFILSRGTTKSFYEYFQANNLGPSFTNSSVQENGNATIFFNVNIPNEPTIVPNPRDVFNTAMNRLKAAGVKIEFESGNVPYFQLGSLTGEVGPGNAGFAGLDDRGFSIGGGYYKSL